jgi:ubiquinone/menaquinone biosynthesis C-methylase UbiE
MLPAARRTLDGPCQSRSISVSDLHAGFQRADADARGDGLFAFLERVDGLPQVQAIKRRMAELLGPSTAQHLLEVGCGMGHEVRRLAGRVAPGGSVLGIDMNHAMIDEARRRTADLGGAVRCQVGDVQRLELGDDAVDGVRTERVLMYVPDQQRAIGELARVVRPGGRVVAFELDYGATLVDLPDHGAAQRVLDALGHTVAHRWMGRALARAFHQAGLRDIVAEPRPIALPPAIHRQLVAPALAAAVETGTLEAHAYRHWLAAARDAERGGYHSDTFVGMVVSARKPEPGHAAIAR